MNQEIISCNSCGKEITAEEELITLFDVLEGNNQRAFCCKEHAKSWVTGRYTGMIFSLLLGIAVAVGIMVSEKSAWGLLLLFLPYMIRRMVHGFRSWDITVKGTFGEIVFAIASLLGSFTMIYPIVKLVQEIRSMHIDQ